jgi:NitT/TauT family transport system permease protein
MSSPLDTRTAAATPAAPVRGSGRRRWIRPVRIVLSGVALYLLWALLAPHYPGYVLPAPVDVWDSFVTTFERGAWTEQVLNTLEHLVLAFVLIIVIGLPLGIVIGRSAIADDLSRIPLVFLQTVPSLVLISLVLVARGATDSSVVIVSVAGSLTYFVLPVIQGTRAIDRDLVDMARAYKASEPTIMRSVVLPSVVPYFLAGARVTLGVAWQITLFTEYLMGTPGIGFQISGAIKLLDTQAVFMWGLSVVALTLAVEYGILRPIEHRLTRHIQREGS